MSQREYRFPKKVKLLIVVLATDKLLGVLVAILQYLFTTLGVRGVQYGGVISAALKDC